MSFRSLLVQTVELLNRTVGDPDAYGTIEETFTSAGEIQASMQEARDVLGLTDAGQTDMARHLAFFEADVDIDVNDRIVYSGRTFRVDAMIDAAGRTHHREVILVEIPEDAA